MIQNRAFSKSFYVQEPTVITIAPNPLVPKISLICDKGDSIRIIVKQNNTKALALNFEGSNAKGQEIFFKSPLFKGGKLDGFINSVLQKATSLKHAVILVENVKSSLLKP